MTTDCLRRQPLAASAATPATPARWRATAAAPSHWWIDRLLAALLLPAPCILSRGPFSFNHQEAVFVATIVSIGRGTCVYPAFLHKCQHFSCLRNLSETAAVPKLNQKIVLEASQLRPLNLQGINVGGRRIKQSAALEALFAPKRTVCARRYERITSFAGIERPE
jgi:hypothetical protein